MLPRSMVGLYGVTSKHANQPGMPRLQEDCARGIVCRGNAYFVHASRTRPSFLQTQTRNVQTTQQKRNVTGTVNNKFPSASMGLRTLMAIPHEASTVSKAALVVLCLQMDASAGGWLGETGSEAVIVAGYMTHVPHKRYMRRGYTVISFVSGLLPMRQTVVGE